MPHSAQRTSHVHDPHNTNAGNSESELFLLETRGKCSNLSGALLLYRGIVCAGATPPGDKHAGPAVIDLSACCTLYSEVCAVASCEQHALVLPTSQSSDEPCDFGARQVRSRRSSRCRSA